MESVVAVYYIYKCKHAANRKAWNMDGLVLYTHDCNFIDFV